MALSLSTEDKALHFPATHRSVCTLQLQQSSEARTPQRRLTHTPPPTTFGRALHSTCSLTWSFALESGTLLARPTFGRLRFLIRMPPIRITIWTCSCETVWQGGGRGCCLSFSIFSFGVRAPLHRAIGHARPAPPAPSAVSSGCLSYGLDPWRLVQDTSSD